MAILIKMSFAFSLCSTVTELYGRRYGEMRRKRIKEIKDKVMQIFENEGYKNIYSKKEQELSRSIWREEEYEDFI